MSKAILGCGEHQLDACVFLPRVCTSSSVCTSTSRRIFVFFVRPQCGTISCVTVAARIHSGDGWNLFFLTVTNIICCCCSILQFWCQLRTMCFHTYLTVVDRSGIEWFFSHGVLTTIVTWCAVICKGPAVQNDMRRKMLHWRCCSTSMTAVTCHSAELVATEIRN